MAKSVNNNAKEPTENFSSVIQVDEATKGLMEEIENNLLDGIYDPIAKLQRDLDEVQGTINEFGSSLQSIDKSNPEVSRSVSELKTKAGKLQFSVNMLAQRVNAVENAQNNLKKLESEDRRKINAILAHLSLSSEALEEE